MPRRPATENEIASRVAKLVLTLEDCISEGAKVFTGPSTHFHHRTVHRLAELGSVENAVSDDTFANYLYATVACWGMHRMGPKGAKMCGFNEFQESLVRNAKTIQELSTLSIQQLPENTIESIRAELWKLINGKTGIKVSASNFRLVAGSKVLHHLLPHLMPPIDRTYTANFFMWKNRMQNAPEEMFCDTFPRLAQLARKIEIPAARYIGSGFNTSLTKFLDNGIVGFIRRNGLSADEDLD